ncbi:MAG: rhomboid family intramembrane serine protease [Armatimonadetes bacterium CG_4_10_14_3_um_filter_66_18]|nr:rhomboid family intramembrane serine protease [Armatimonadota bacterium]OIP10753.1 MAG: hypothetical protein AUJ96_03460 [Armatimonadetes bacterium CG2_30_66_41]PIU94823.1 MAG: rhomboid family intramembrane serine protease [Armatimonadetes bacterium CG06_land_8_20_14_3_00_66_21]PIW14820.1 MAG: rhomboid family intramembrane serine protease [Armatimonadetes bacterium CG17_big_fil_post_rev_8_21_14_2_50_66_6]PIX36769.1 MAG: rhomboid family intramembrane serine protease [Armatimonadetes bacterium
MLPTLPLRDNIESRTYPGVTILLIVTNVVVFLWQVLLPRGADQEFMAAFALIPARLFDLGSYTHFGVVPTLCPLVTHMFLHGGWLHVGFNMLFLWIFGDNVEDLLGHFRFLVFYFVCGLCAVLTFIVSSPGSGVPLVGASGAIAGVLGAYFLSFPKSTIETLIPLFGFIPVRIPIPSVIFLGLWFFLQLKYGMLLAGASGGGVAWWAHIGGFVAGMLLLKPFKPKQRVVMHRPKSPRT